MSLYLMSDSVMPRRFKALRERGLRKVKCAENDEPVDLVCLVMEINVVDMVHLGVDPLLLSFSFN